MLFHAHVVLAMSILAASASAQPFVDSTADLGLTLNSGPAAWGDINGDGWPDLACAGAVWINKQGLSFSRVATPVTGIIADIDNDGDGDLIAFAPIAIYRNTAASASDTPTFEPVALPDLPKTLARGAAVGDYNNDGYVDVYFGGYEVWDPQTTYPDLLLLSDSGERFELAFSSSAYRARGVTACDFDEDGDLDIYVSNYRLQPNALWVNEGEGKLADRAAALNTVATSADFNGGHSIGACWGDFDNDGHFDLFAGNFAHVDSRGDQPKSRFLKNLGPETDQPFGFDDLGECGVWYQESYASPAAGDFDNDGDLDLYFTTVYANASFGKKNYPVLYRNDSTVDSEPWGFADATEASGLEQLPATYQAAWADFDHDGDLDLVTAGKLFVNQLQSDAHWLEVRLRGNEANLDAIGAQARITLPDGRTLSRQVELGTGEGNANSPILHFGLGEFAGPVALVIRWPGGERQTTQSVPVDQLVTIEQGAPGTP